MGFLMYKVKSLSIILATTMAISTCSPCKTISTTRKIFNTGIYGALGSKLALNIKEEVTKTILSCTYMPFFILTKKYPQYLKPKTKKSFQDNNKALSIMISLALSAFYAAKTVLYYYGAKLLLGKALKTLQK